MLMVVRGGGVWKSSGSSKGRGCAKERAILEGGKPLEPETDPRKTGTTPPKSSGSTDPSAAGNEKKKSAINK